MKMRRQKRQREQMFDNIIRATIFLGIVIGCVAMGTLAYLTHTRRGNHFITIGTNEISITESYKPPKELKAGANVYQKSVKIKNTGTTSAFIRVFLDFSDYAAGSRSYFAVDKPGKVNIEDGATVEEAKEAIEAAGFLAYDDFYVGDTERNGWIYVPEDEDSELGGYFYYTGIVEAGKSTEELIDSVCTYFESAEAVEPYQIYVYAESVQIYDKDGNAFEDSQWRDAWEEFLSRK